MNILDDEHKGFDDVSGRSEARSVDLKGLKGFGVVRVGFGARVVVVHG